MPVFIAVVIATFTNVYPSLDTDWVDFVDPDGFFRVSMPDSVEFFRDTIDAEIGRLVFVNMQASEQIDSFIVRYTLGYCDYPAGTFDPDSAELIDLFLDETVSETVVSSRGTLLYADAIPGVAYPSRVWRIDAPHVGVSIKSRAMLVGDRFYNLQVVAPKEIGIKYDSEKFFNSVKILKS